MRPRGITRQAVCLLALLLLAPSAWAQEADAGAADAGPVVVPPSLLEDSPAPYPPEAAQRRLEGEVRLRITIEADGSVSRSELLAGVDPVLDQGALEAAMALRFSPATVGGVATPSTIGFNYHFTAPAEAPRPKEHGLLVGELRRRGRNVGVAGAVVAARRKGEPPEAAITTQSDAKGRFQLELEAGEWLISVAGTDVDRTDRLERLGAGQRVEVIYYLTGPKSPFETVVVGERERTEVSRTELSGEELRAVPGTMGGDPFRAVLALPGVSAPVSGVAFPIVRGAAPASTGWYLDGVALPNLFHFFLLSAVVNPAFIEGLDFYPSAYPAEYGRFTGGIISAHTATGRTDRAHGEASVDLVNSGAFVEAPVEVGGQTISLAAGGRVSYLGVGLRAVDALGLLPNSGYADYWDYQARAEAHLFDVPGTFRLFAFGSHDEVGITDNGQKQRVLGITFHRLDARWRGEALGAKVEAALTGGLDDLGAGPDVDVSTRELLPRVTFAWRRGPLTLRTGADGEWKRLEVLAKGQEAGAAGQQLKPIVGGAYGAFAELSAELGRFTLTPGLRFDQYRAERAHQEVLEPRLALRFRLDEATVLKLGGGLYHQAPTAYVELPFVDILSLSEGLQESAHAVLGVERRIEALGVDVDASLYWSEKLVLRELEVSDPDQLTAPPTDCGQSGCDQDPFRARRGRSIGLELLVRRRLTEHLFGWVAYTLSRTTRWSDGNPAYPELFDQTHILNAVASYKLPYGFQVGLGLHLNTGKPYDTYRLETVDPTQPLSAPGKGCSSPRPDGSVQCWVLDEPRGGRLPPFVRVDARVEKAWVYDRFTLTLYLDVLNASLQQEVLSRDYGFDQAGNPTTTDTKLPLVVPMLGVKGAF